MGRFLDMGCQNHCFFNFSARSPRESLNPNVRPKNPLKNYLKRILWSSRKLDTPFLGLLAAAMRASSRCHFRRPLSRKMHLRRFRSGQKASQESRQHQNMVSKKDFKLKIIELQFR